MAAAHPFGSFVGCRFKRIGIAHFARLQETTSQCALTLCHAVFRVLRLLALLGPALRPPASQCAPGLSVPAVSVTDMPHKHSVCGPGTLSRLRGSTKPYNRRQPLVQSLCGPFDSSQQTLYNRCVNTRNEMTSIQVMNAVPWIWRHVWISEGHLEGRRYKIYKHRCAQL